MIKYVIASILSLVALFSSAQPEHSAYFKGDTTLNERIFWLMKKHFDPKQFDTLCMESCAFVFFTASAKGIEDIRMSPRTPQPLLLALEKSLEETAPFWKGRKKIKYLLPVVYVFESDCQPAGHSSNLIMRILLDVSNQPDKIIFPGFGNEKPITCTILNPYFIISGYH